MRRPAVRFRSAPPSPSGDGRTEVTFPWITARPGSRPARPSGPLGVRPAKGPPEPFADRPHSAQLHHLHREMAEPKSPSPGSQRALAPGLRGPLLKKGLPIHGLCCGMRLPLVPVWFCLLTLLPLTALAADDGGDQKSAEHKLTQSKSYLSLDPIYTTIVDDNRAQGMLMVGIGLDVPRRRLARYRQPFNAGAARRLCAQSDGLHHHVGAHHRPARCGPRSRTGCKASPIAPWARKARRSYWPRWPSG